MGIVDEQASSLTNPLKSLVSIHHPTTDVSEVTSDKQNVVYKTDKIILEEEHALSTIVSKHDFPIFEEPFQVIQTKITHKESTISPKQMINSEDQLSPFYDEKHDDEIQKTSLNSELASSTSPKSPPATSLDANNFDEGKKSTSTVANDQSIVEGASTIEENFELSQKLQTYETDRNIPPILALEDIEVNFFALIMNMESFWMVLLL